MANKTAWLFLVVFVGVFQVNANRNVLVGTPRSIGTGDELVGAVIRECIGGDNTMKCVRVKALQYLDTVVGVREAKNLDGDLRDDQLDAKIVERVGLVLNEGEFSVRLPEVIFQSALIKVRPGKGIQDLRVSFPKDMNEEGRAMRQARGLLKKKLLLPALLLLKLKLKALMPIFVAIIGAKALKALVLSKIAVLLVVGFLIVQLCKKAGMMMPMAMNMGMTNGMDAMAAAMMGQYGAPAAPTNQYGVPPQPTYGPPAQPPTNQYGPPAQPPTNQYGPPAQSPSNQYGAPASSTSSSYDPNSWAPVDSSGSGTSNTASVVSPNGPYSRWDAHNIAYSSYQPSPQDQSSTSTSASAQS